MGRTARGEGSSGHALMVLRPEELGFLRYLKQARIPVNEFDFSWNKIADIQLQVSIKSIMYKDDKKKKRSFFFIFSSNFISLKLCPVLRHFLSNNNTASLVKHHMQHFESNVS